MRDFKRCLTRLVMLLLATTILFSATPVYAAGPIKTVPTRAIAIVYDNSASMYGIGGDPQAWCRATYAIEVFASMLNVGDILQVYPMHPIEVNTKTYSRGGNPLVIHGGEDPQCIEQIYTINASATPVETITDAFDGLKEVPADEHWLIVLTDGDFTYGDTNDKVSPEEVGEILNNCNREVQTLFMGIGSSAVSPEGFPNCVMAKQSDQVLTELTDICNQIFGRDTLNVTGDNLTFDVSLSKLIVFVQGEDIQNVTVSDSSGKPVGAVLATRSPHYSEMPFGRGGKTLPAEVDDGLSGQLITFENCAAGSYTLSYSGNKTSVSAYFEPDVNIQVQLLGENGQPIEVGEALSAGTYEITYNLIDRVTGEPINSPLLKNTEYRIDYSTGTEQQSITDSKGGKFYVELLPGDVLDAEFHVTFLDGYRIDRTGDDFGWPKAGLHITEKPAGELHLKLSGGADIYELSALENQATYFAELYYNGEKLCGDALENVELFPELNSASLNCQLEKKQDGYQISLTHVALQRILRRETIFCNCMQTTAR